MDRNAYQMLIAFNRETKKLDDVYRSAAKSCGVSECAFWILYTLRVEEKPFTQAEICEFLIEPKQTVNSALKKLEAERDALIRLTGRYRALFAQRLNCI